MGRTGFLYVIYDYKKCVAPILSFTEEENIINLSPNVKIISSKRKIAAIHTYETSE